eukprot:2510304-Rhodomonas_salina.1
MAKSHRAPPTSATPIAKVILAFQGHGSYVSGLGSWLVARGSAKADAKRRNRGLRSGEAAAKGRVFASLCPIVLYASAMRCP